MLHVHFMLHYVLALHVGAACRCCLSHCMTSRMSSLHVRLACRRCMLAALDGCRGAISGGFIATATAEQKAQVHVGDRDRKAMARAGLIEVEPGHWARAPGPSMDSRAEKAEAKPKK